MQRSIRNDEIQRERSRGCRVRGSRTRPPVKHTFVMAVVAATVQVLATAAGAELNLITPCRVFDSRTVEDGPALVGLTARSVTVRGRCGIPPGATGITYNATIVTPEAPGYLTLYPSDVDLPRASSLNFAAGGVAGNGGVVKLAASEPSLSAYLATAPAGLAADLVIDVTGYHAGTLVGVMARSVSESVTIDRWLEHGDGTATDRLTGLQWELKTDDGLTHDKDDRYSWSNGLSGVLDGTAFTVFLPILNALEFAGHDDWRLPTMDELQSIVDPGFPYCESPPCTTIPGETAPYTYYSSSPSFHEPGEPGIAIVRTWGVNFQSGDTRRLLGWDSYFVRAVRGGS